MRDTLQMALALAVGLLALDVLGFVFWVASGQYPTDGFYLGTITAHVLAVLF